MTGPAQLASIFRYERGLAFSLGIIRSAMFRSIITSVPVLAIALDARPADACTPFVNGEYSQDAAHANDSVAPSNVDVNVAFGEVPDMCGWDTGLALRVMASDDMTPTDRLGYQLRIIAGTVPSGWPQSDAPVTVGLAGELVFQLYDDELAFTLEVAAVDLNHNVGPPTIVEIEHGGGCSSTAPQFSLVPFLAIAGVVLRRTRRRRRGTPAPSPVPCLSERPHE